MKKTGELDIIAQIEDTLHFVEVKTVLAEEFPLAENKGEDVYDPSLNLHAAKVRKVARTGEWYVLEKKWKGSGKWTDVLCGCAAETASRVLTTYHKSCRVFGSFVYIPKSDILGMW